MRAGLKVFMPVLMVVVGIILWPNSTPTAAQEAADGCVECHADLRADLPEDHPQLSAGDAAYCLACHGSQGAAIAMTWETHLNHYAQEDFPGDCFSCHLIADGQMTLIATYEESEEAEEAATVEPATAPEPTATSAPEASVSPTVRPTRTPRPTPTPKPLDEDWALEMTQYFQSWAGSEWLDHTHARVSVTCEQCHETFFPERSPAADPCLACHGSYALLAELTQGEEGEANPHDSHLGPVKCSSCHLAHEESVVLCLECHIFEMEMPEWGRSESRPVSGG